MINKRYKPIDKNVIWLSLYFYIIQHWVLLSLVCMKMFKHG